MASRRSPARLRRGRSVRLSAGTEPPSAFKLFPYGTIETDKGLFFLTEDDAQACVAAHVAYGNDLSIDYGHGVFQEDTSQQKAAGWIGAIEARPDGLYAARVTWTATAAALIRAREQRYFSPWFETDEAQHVRRINNVALTLAPATHNLVPLVASRVGGSKKRTLSMADETEKYCKASDLHALADKMMVMAGDKNSDELKALAEEMRALAQGGEEKDGDGDGGDDEGDGEGEGGEGGEGSSQATSLLSLVSAITGKTSPAEMAGALAAMKQGQEQVTKLSKRVAELEGADRRTKVDQMVAEAARAGKLTPAMREQAVALGLRDPAFLRGWLSALPKVVAMRDGAPDATPAPTEDDAARLSAEQEQILSKAGVKDPKAFATFLRNEKDR